MNILERIEEMAAVAGSCRSVSENTSELSDIVGKDNFQKAVLVNQSLILAAQGVILRNMGLNLAQKYGGN